MFGLFRKPDPYVQPEGQTVFWVRVRTDRSGEEVVLRLTKGNEIGPEGAGYYVRKSIVAPKSLDRAELEIWFDRGYRVVRTEVSQGSLVPIRDWRSRSE